MPTPRAVRRVLLIAAGSLLISAVAADATGVWRGRETYFRATFRQLTGGDDATAKRLAYVVNQYTLAAVGLALVALAFRSPTRRKM